MAESGRLSSGVGRWNHKQWSFCTFYFTEIHTNFHSLIHIYGDIWHLWYSGSPTSLMIELSHYPKNESMIAKQKVGTIVCPIDYHTEDCFGPRGFPNTLPMRLMHNFFSLTTSGIFKDCAVCILKLQPVLGCPFIHHFRTRSCTFNPSVKHSCLEILRAVLMWDCRSCILFHRLVGDARKPGYRYEHCLYFHIYSAFLLIDTSLHYRRQSWSSDPHPLLGWNNEE